MFFFYNSLYTHTHTHTHTQTKYNNPRACMHSAKVKRVETNTDIIRIVEHEARSGVGVLMYYSYTVQWMCFEMQKQTLITPFMVTLYPSTLMHHNFV